MTSLDAEYVSETAVGDALLQRFELRGWRDAYGVLAGVTGREHDFRVTAATGAEGTQAGAWGALRAAVGSGFHAIVVSRQVHGTAVKTHHGRMQGLHVEPGLDGHLTARAGVLLTVTLADCIPIYFLHPASGTLGLVHAGWRGTAAGVLEAGVARLCALTDGSPRELVIHCGVGICGVCYQVGSEVIAAIRRVRVRGPRRLDLRGELAGRALRLGVQRVTVSAWCTAHDHDRFHSYRWEGPAAGRMVGYLGRPAP